jgi:hypothetical protein
MNIGEKQLGLIDLIAAQPGPFVREGFAHMIGFSFVRQETAGGNLFHFAVRRIKQRFVVLIEPADAGLVKGQWEFATERC